MIFINRVIIFRCILFKKGQVFFEGWFCTPLFQNNLFKTQMKENIKKINILQYKIRLLFFTLISISLYSIVNAQTFVAKPATFVSADKTAEVGIMNYLLDGEGKTGNVVDGKGPGDFYWLRKDNPVTFNINMNSSSKISAMKFYLPWGWNEGAKNITIRFYNSSTLLGTENLVLPYQYAGPYYLKALTKAYLNVTKVQFVVVDDWLGSTVSPNPRTSLQEIVFGDLVCNAGTVAPPVKDITNVCPSTSINLNDAHTGTIPSGTSLVWFTNNTHTGTALTGTQVTEVTSSGTYYAFYYDSVNKCYSPSSIAVNVAINNIDFDGDGVPDICDSDNDNDGILDVNEKYCDASTAPNGINGFPFSNSPATPPLFTKQLLFFDLNGVTFNSSSGTITKSIVYNGVTYTATISDFASTDSAFQLFGNDIVTYSNSDHYVHKYYNVANIKEVLYSNLIKTTASFNVSIKAVKSGVEYPVDLVFFDAEGTDAVGGENITVKLISGKDFNLLEKTGTATMTSSIISVTNNQIQYLNTEFGNVNGLFYTSGYSPKINASIKTTGSGKQGFGFAVRVYCDTDNDGISNYLDLDSDGDGCADAIEGAGNFTSSQLSNASGNLNSQIPNKNFGIVVDTNGIPTTVGASGQEIGRSQDFTKNDCIDSDGDGYPDWQDLDDDNDGILDTVENCIDNTMLTLDRNNISGVSTFSVVGGNNDVTPATAGYAYWVGQNSQDESIKYTFTNSVYSIQIPQVINISGNSTIDSELLEVYINGTLYPITASMVVGLNPSSFITSGGAIGNTNTSILTNFTSINIDYPAGIKSIMIRNNPNNTSVGMNGWEMNGLKILSRSTCNADIDGDGILNSLDLDSDNDGCPDAIEGGANFTTSDLVNSAMPGGNSGATSGTYNQPVIQNLGNTVGITATTMGVPTIAGTGQAIDDSQNSSINNQCNFPCYKPAQTTGTILDTNHGITSLGRAGADNSNWPMVRKGAWTALESKTKGFVVNRIPTTAAVNAIANPVEGMMVYDEEADCLKINTDGTTTGWKCFNTPACPD